MLRVFCPAKVNLFLHVTGRRGDGYHEIDSLAVFASVGDVLLAEKSDAETAAHIVSAGQPLPVDENNTLFKAHRFLEGMAGRPLPVNFWLHKHLPAAAGIGGGSADAAGAIRALCHLYALSLTAGQQQEAARACGADVPACLLGRSCRMQGLGEIVTPVTLAAPLPAVLANPGLPLATADVFAAFAADPRHAGPARPVWPHEPNTFLYALEETSNSLYPPAAGLCPAIDDVLSALQRTAGCQLTRMSGSGPTCLGLYASVHQAEAAARQLQAAQPGWWVSACWLS